MKKRMVYCLLICFGFMFVILSVCYLGNMHDAPEIAGGMREGEYILQEDVMREGKTLQLLKRICVTESGFGTSSINVSKFRTSAVVSTEFGQLIGYFKSNGKAYLALLQENEMSEIEIVDNMPSHLLGDGHCSISIAYDKGKVWYAYGAHCCKGWWGRLPMKNFGNVTKTYAKESASEFSYPQFYKTKDALYFICRNEEEYWSCQKITANSTLSFESVLLYGKARETLYINDLGVSENGKYAAIPFVERVSMENNHVRNDGIYLIWSDDSMETWKSIKNDQLTLPIEFKDTSKILVLNPDGNLMNQESTYVSDTGEIFFTYMYDDVSGIPQIYLGRFSLTTKETKSWQITDQHKDFDMLGKGTLWLPLSRAQVIGSDNYIHIICRVDQNIHIYSCKRNITDFGLRFDNFTIEEDVGAWEPNYDVALWEKENTLCLFVQDVLQGESDILAAKTKVSPIYLYYFKER